MVREEYRDIDKIDMGISMLEGTVLGLGAFGGAILVNTLSKDYIFPNNYNEYISYTSVVLGELSGLILTLPLCKMVLNKINKKYGRQQNAGNRNRI